MTGFREKADVRRCSLTVHRAEQSQINGCSEILLNVSQMSTIQHDSDMHQSTLKKKEKGKKSLHFIEIRRTTVIL